MTGGRQGRTVGGIQPTWLRGVIAVCVLQLIACDGMGDPPWVEVPPQRPSGVWLSVLLSGDGGWASTDRSIAEGLADHDIPTIGLNSLRYFWTERTPAEASDMLARMMERYLDEWQRERVVLIGFSRGANSAPFMVDDLSPALRARIGLVVMLSPTIETTFVFRMRDWLQTVDWPDAVPVAPAVDRMRPIRILCIYGRDDADALCPHLPPGVADVRAFPGGHHFGGETERVVTDVLSELGRLE